MKVLIVFMTIQNIVIIRTTANHVLIVILTKTITGTKLIMTVTLILMNIKERG